MKNVGNIILAAVTIALSPLAFMVWIVLFWVAPVIGFIQWRRQARLLKRTLPDLVCSVDTDCPPGYVCMGNRCVPARVR